MHSVNNPKIRVFLISSLFKFKDKIKYSKTTIIDIILKTIIYFLLINGLFFVSAGA